MNFLNYEQGTVVPYTAEIEKLSSGESLEMHDPTVKDKSHISFTCDIASLDDDFMISVGRGYMYTSGCWVEITKTHVRAFTYFYYTDPQLRVLEPQAEHGLEISDFLTVLIDEDKQHGSFIVLTTASGSVKLPCPTFAAWDGKIFASAKGCELENCKLNWLYDGFAFPIWIYGDSYLGYGHPARWPYYLYRDGYDRVLLSGYPGMNTQRGLVDFKCSLERGTPKFALWLLGMNNSDPSVDEPETNWLKATEEFLAICKEKGITPILSTIPCVPDRINEAKNAWVRASGYRYIDFNRAVGAHKSKEWYPGMLCPDRVHPAANGAAALYSQVLIDFPEIMKR